LHVILFKIVKEHSELCPDLTAFTEQFGLN